MMIHLNAIKSWGKPFAKGFPAHKISLDIREEGVEEKQRLSRIVARALQTRFQGLTAISSENGKIIVFLISEKEPDIKEVEVRSRGIIYKVPLKFDGTFIIQDHNVMNEFLQNALKERARERGFHQHFYGNKFYGGSPKFFVVGEAQEPVYVYSGFRFKTRVFEDGMCLVFLKPIAVFRISLLEYVNYMLGRGISIDEVKDFIINGRPKRLVKVLPYGTTGMFIDMDYKRNPYKEPFENGTIASYWWERYKVRLPENDFVVWIDIEKASLKYPASQVYISTKELPFTHEQRKVFVPSPKKEKELTLQLARRLLEKPLKIGGLTVSFEIDHLVTLDELQQEGKIQDYGRLKLPQLRFYKGGIGTKPLDIKKYGPFSGPKNVNVLFLTPSPFKDIIPPFFECLKDAYEAHRYGKLNNIGIIELKDKPTKINYRRIAQDVVNKLKNIPHPSIGIIILPRRGEEKFEFIKGSVSDRMFANKSYLFLLIDTVKKVMEGRKEILESIINKIYYRCVSEGDKALWILKEPAGNVGNTMYAAYDVSRDVQRKYDEVTKQFISERREAASRAAICDCFGLTVRIKSEISPIGEIMTSDIVRDLILNLESDSRESLAKFGHEFKRLVLFKDGEVHKNERNIVRMSVNEVRESIPDLRFEFFSVIKGGIERVFFGDSNPPPGFYIVFNENNALLISSDLSLHKDKVTGEERVLANPLMIRKELVLDGDTPMKQILQEFFDLTHLHWQSPIFKTKSCLPLQLVQEMGHYSRRGIVMPMDISYLPI
jgi:hypothetical protein